MSELVSLKSPLYVSFRAGLGSAEPRVDNKRFLEFLGNQGLWIRLWSAYRSWKVLQGKPGPLESNAAVVNFWEQAGMLYEGAMGTLVAHCALKEDPQILLADVYARVFVKREGGDPPKGPSYVSLTLQRLLDECRKAEGERRKPVGVDSLRFAEELRQRSDEDALMAIGIPWKKQPSVKRVPRERTEDWERLPVLMRGLLELMAAPKKRNIELIYNKLKHGPQFVVMDPHDAAMSKGLSPELASTLKEIGPSVRLLFDGARTEASQEETEQGDRVAPFLLHDAWAVGSFLKGNLLNIANAVCFLTEWVHWELFRTEFRGARQVREPAWESMIRELYSAEFAPSPGS